MAFSLTRMAHARISVASACALRGSSSMLSLALASPAAAASGSACGASVSAVSAAPRLLGARHITSALSARQAAHAKRMAEQAAAGAETNSEADAAYRSAFATATRGMLQAERRAQKAEGAQFRVQPLTPMGEPSGPAESLDTPTPLDPRHFRLPNASFIMLRVYPTAKSAKKMETGGPESRRQTRGAPVDPMQSPSVSRESDPTLVAFRVPLNFNKIQIRNYLEEIYNVDVVDVRTMIYLGATRRSPRTGRPEKKSDYKKAYVRLLHPFPYPTLAEQRLLDTVEPPALQPEGDEARWEDTDVDGRLA